MAKDPTSSFLGLIVAYIRIAENAMSQLYQRQIKSQFACAQKLEAKQAVGLNQQVILLAADVPEMWSVVFHSLGSSFS